MDDGYRVNDVSNDFFCLQKRRGHGEGKGWAAKFIGTLDNFRDTKVIGEREREQERRGERKRQR